MSSGQATIRPAAAAASAASLSAERALAMTSAPSRASRRASAAPMPMLAPVIHTRSPAIGGRSGEAARHPASVISCGTARSSR